MLYTILLKSHSGLRWLLLFMFIATLVQLGRKAFGKADISVKSISLFTLIVTHIQFLIGLVLYFISPKVVFDAASMKDSILRFYLVEHISLMIIAIIILTIGYSKSKQYFSVPKGAKKAFYYYLTSLVLILISIPWPFRIPIADWF
ncbi:MAG: cytochrome B [Bacteroidales bacterium]|nr:cytochrome B [Bacteroidales bacterium]